MADAHRRCTPRVDRETRCRLSARRIRAVGPGSSARSLGDRVHQKRTGGRWRRRSARPRKGIGRASRHIAARDQLGRGREGAREDIGRPWLPGQIASAGRAVVSWRRGGHPRQRLPHRTPRSGFTTATWLFKGQGRDAHEHRPSMSCSQRGASPPSAVVEWAPGQWTTTRPS